MKNLILFLALLFSFNTGAQWSQDRLSEPKAQLGGASSWQNPHFWFAGGYTDAVGVVGSVELYDVDTKTWYLSQLSIPRGFPAVIVHAGKVCIAGGADFDNGIVYSTVDIANDATSNQDWHTASLSAPRFSISTAAHGNKILFAGGANLNASSSSNIVDIYDVAADTWSVQHLSAPRAAMGSGVAHNGNGQALAVFAGGFDLATGVISNRVDIYNFDTDTWTTAALSEPRCFVASAVVGNKLLIAGGMRPDNTPTSQVDIYDPVADQWSTTALPEPRAFLEQNGATVNGEAYFAGGGRVNMTNQSWFMFSDQVAIYSGATGTWRTELLTTPVVNHVVVSNGSRLMVAGGAVDFGVTDNIDVLTTTLTGQAEVDEPDRYTITPNPCTGQCTLFPASFQGPGESLSIMDMGGRLVKDFREWPVGGALDLSDLMPGIYLVNLRYDRSSQCLKLVIQ